MSAGQESEVRTDSVIPKRKTTAATQHSPVIAQRPLIRRPSNWSNPAARQGRDGHSFDVMSDERGRGNICTDAGSADAKHFDICHGGHPRSEINLLEVKFHLPASPLRSR